MSVLSEVSPASWEVQNQALKKETGRGKETVGDGSEERDKKEGDMGRAKETLYIKGFFVHY